MHHHLGVSFFVYITYVLYIGTLSYRKLVGKCFFCELSPIKVAAFQRAVPAKSRCRVFRRCTGCRPIKSRNTICLHASMTQLVFLDFARLVAFVSVVFWFAFGGVDLTLACHFIAFEVFVVGRDLVDQGAVWQDLHDTVRGRLHDLVVTR